MDNLLAVDAGGTSTRAIVLSPTGRCLGYGTGGSGNPISSGPEHAARQVALAARAALEGAAASGAGGRAVLAMAGSRTNGATDWVAAELRAVGVDAEIVLESDLLATFCSGAWEPDGYAVVAGTGAAAIRVRGGGQEGTSDGLGWLLGDAGSGFWIGRRVVRAVAAELDRRGPATALTPLLLDTLAAEGDDASPISLAGRPLGLRRLLDAVYESRPIDIARYAPLVFAVGDDAVAGGIRAGAQEALRTTLASVQADDVRGPVVCGGGVLGALGLAVDGVRGVTEVRRVSDGAAGSAVLALRANGVAVDEAVFATIGQTLAALRGAA